MQRNIVKRLGLWAVIVAAILIVPFLAKAPWTSTDFIFAGSVLGAAAVTYEVATKTMASPRNRFVVAAVIMLALVLIEAWAVA